MKKDRRTKKQTDLLKKFGKRIRELRKQKKLTQLELGVLCDSFAEHIGKIERGELNVTLITMDLLAKALDVKIEDLVKAD
jgi:transcriptional regulator with XRE-family HTH domain